ncbi:mannosyl-oligosaccharide 1,2-alpha-mannosidase IA-like [Oppia nitens]|uniref:mannosyl-oligosaccharide 1,2-alpha-mannosidase IA-like n=1 Tax=Oppia nitens TaxID=1686743 RepID=UPI0023DC921F|nr:mannosyl-oligosaccharide 1,2-alpha-mannosidase IA-like [Oppia nitens]
MRTNMLSKETLLPAYYQKPVPFIKIFKKYLPFTAIIMLLTLSVFCYIFMPNIGNPTDFLPKSWPLMQQTVSEDIDAEMATNPSLPVVSQTSDQLASTVNTYDNNRVLINQQNIDDNNKIKDTVRSDSTDSSMKRPFVNMLPSGDDTNATVRAQRDFIKDMMRHSWDNYVKYAWGHNELQPLTRTSHTSDIFGGDSKLGATIVDSLDTLYIMNMTDEFMRGRNWISKNLNFGAVDSDMSVFETVIRFVGGLLTCYAFTKDPMFLEKARHVADHMLPAFNTDTGLPLALINPKTTNSHNYGWASGGDSILSELGSHHLEFMYLSVATGDIKYKNKVMKIRSVVDNLEKPYNGLYRNYINPKTGQWGQDEISIGALGDSFYEYLIKAWIQSNGTDEQALRLYNNAVQAINNNLVKKSTNGLTYLAKQTYGRLEHKMEHLTCFSGGMFAIGAQYETDANKKQYYMALGANITDTCYESYRRTATQIGPEAFFFTPNEEAVALNNNEKYYILRPEVIESYFYLWRLTHDQRFRDYAWSAAQAINKYCRTDSGFSGIRNTSDINSAKDDVQQTFWLAEGLKYLYLIFSSDDLLPLNQWVFNTEAHPFPVLNLNKTYLTENVL